MFTTQNEIYFTLNKISSLRGAERRSNLEIEHTQRLFTHPVFSTASYLESTPLDRGEYSWQSGLALTPEIRLCAVGAPKEFRNKPPNSHHYLSLRLGKTPTRTTEIKGLKW